MKNKIRFMLYTIFGMIIIAGLTFATQTRITDTTSEFNDITQNGHSVLDTSSDVEDYITADSIGDTQIDDAYINQALTTSSSPTFAGATMDSLNASEINNLVYVTALTDEGIRNAITNCDGIIPCKIKLIKGTYNINNHIILKSNVILEGEKDSTILNMTSGGLGYVFGVNANSENVTLKDFYLKNNNLSTGYIIDFRSVCNNCNFEGLHISNSPSTPIVIYGDNINIKNNWLDNVNAGISLDTPFGSEHHSKIIGNFIENKNYNATDPNEYGEGIDVNAHYINDSTSIISRNTFIGFREEAIDCNAQTCIITQNRIKLPGDESRACNGITIGHGINSSTNNRNATGSVIGNYIYGIGIGSNYHGIDINGYGYLVSGNIIQGLSDSSGIGLYLNDGDNHFVSGNQFYNLGIAIYDNLASSAVSLFIGNSYQDVGTERYWINSATHTSILDYDNLDFNYNTVHFSDLQGNNVGATQTILMVNNSQSAIEGVKFISNIYDNNYALGLHVADNSNWMKLVNDDGTGRIKISPDYTASSPSRSMLISGSASSSNWDLHIRHDTAGKKFNLHLDNGSLYMNNNPIIDSTTSRQVSDEGLVLGMNFNSEDITGTTVLDSSGQGNDGTNNGATFNSTGGFNGGGAFEFSSNDPIVIDKSVLQTNVFTISFWEYTNGGTGYFLSDGTDVNNLFLRRGNSDPLQVTGMIGDVGFGGFSLLNNQWHHHIITQNSNGDVKWYVDGILKEDISGSNFMGLTSNLYIGNRADLERDFHGSIDDIRIYNRSLSSTEIQNLYEQRAEVKNPYVSRKGGSIQGDLDMGSNTIFIDNGDYVQWSSGAKITSNSTCLILTSPDGTGQVNVCNT